jgi:hypothetical protein
MNSEIRDLIRQMSVANPLWGAPPHSWRTVSHERRRVIHFDVTQYPTQEWLASQ